MPTAEVIDLFLQPRHGVGTYVAGVGSDATGPEVWAVMTPADVSLSVHSDLNVALRRARWHSGARFVYLEGVDACWDGDVEEFVSWDEALTSIRQMLNGRKRYACAVLGNRLESRRARARPAPPPVPPP